MDKVITYIYSNDFEASIDFYGKFGFQIILDIIDGDSTRRVRLTHLLLGSSILALQNRKVLLNLSSEPTTSIFRPYVIFSVATPDYSDWCELAEKQFICIEKEIVEPWGVWYYYRDPCGNLFCVTNNIMC